MTAEPFSFADGEDELGVLDEDGLKVTAFVVDHAPVQPAVGYRFDYRGRSAVISGDTIYAPALVRVAQGADLLLHDALSTRLLKLVEDAVGNAGQQMRRRILADVPDYHATAPQAADAAGTPGWARWRSRTCIPPLPLKGLEEIFMADAREHFSGELWLARDGDLYSLPHRSDGRGAHALDRSPRRLIDEGKHGGRAARRHRSQLRSNTSFVQPSSASAAGASSHGTTRLVTSSGCRWPSAARPSTWGIALRALARPVRKVIPFVYISSSGRRGCSPK